MNMNNEDKIINKENESNKKDKPHSLFLRIIAIVIIISMIGLLGAFVWCIISGSKYIIQMLFLVIIYPMVIYVMIWLKKVFDKRED